MTFTQTPDIREPRRYLVNNLSLSIALFTKTDPMVIIRYWINHRCRYQMLSKVAFRVLATPAFSAGSERHFSAVNKLVTTDRSCLGDIMIADMTFLKSVFTDFTFEDFTEIAYID